MSPLTSDGFELRRRLFGDRVIAALRLEADLLAREANAACVRHLLERSDLIREFTQEPSFSGLLPAGHQPVRSILFNKTAQQNWPVAWHQDLTIAVAAEVPVPGYGPWSIKDGVTHVQPPVQLLETMVTVRLHLDETPPENGALRVIPGSHRAGRLSAEQITRWRSQPEVTCAASPGDALLMRPLLLHASHRSAHPSNRRILHIECAPSGVLDPRLRWAEN